MQSRTKSYTNHPWGSLFTLLLEGSFWELSNRVPVEGRAWMGWQLGGRIFPGIHKALGSSPSMTYKGEVCKMNVLMNLKWMILSSVAPWLFPKYLHKEWRHHLQWDPWLLVWITQRNQQFNPEFNLHPPRLIHRAVGSLSALRTDIGRKHHCVQNHAGSWPLLCDKMGNTDFTELSLADTSHASFSF